MIYSLLLNSSEWKWSADGSLVVRRVCRQCQENTGVLLAVNDERSEVLPKLQSTLHC